MVERMEDVDRLRKLGQSVYDLSQRPVMEERRRLWKKLHRLEMERPMLLTETCGVLFETTPDSMLQCREEWARNLERSLLDRIFYGEFIDDDTVIEPHVYFNATIRESGIGVELSQVQGTSNEFGKGSVHYIPCLSDLDEDLDALRMPAYEIDREATQSYRELLHKIFDGILAVEYNGSYWWTNGLSGEAVQMLGVEGFMLQMYDNPEGLHRLMAYLRDKTLERNHWYESQGLLRPNNQDHYVSSGGVGYTDELPQGPLAPDGACRLRDMWGLSESQETVCVSPEMFDEFVFQYQKPIIEEFGLACYGCCEPVNNRWHIIKRLNNLRTVSVSPWADEERMSEYLGGNYVYSRKVNPTNVSMQVWDEKLIRREIRSTLELTRAHRCNVEIILKDVHTLHHHRERLGDWVRIAREEIGRVYG